MGSGVRLSAERKGKKGRHGLRGPCESADLGGLRFRPLPFQFAVARRQGPVAPQGRGRWVCPAVHGAGRSLLLRVRSLCWASVVTRPAAPGSRPPTRPSTPRGPRARAAHGLRRRLLRCPSSRRFSSSRRVLSAAPRASQRGRSPR